MNNTESSIDLSSDTSEQERSFSSLGLRQELLNNLASLLYTSMTPIQQGALPPMLEGSDLIAQSKTGSGKTAAFGLSLLNRLKPEFFKLQALVLCPTRELAEQVTQALRRLARMIPNIKILNLSGGLPMRPQQNSLKQGLHIVVGTPGRVLKHLQSEDLSVKNLETLVLDEADRMLDMGFLDEMKQVIAFCPEKRQTLLFSATYPPEIEQLARDFMQKPVRLQIKEEDSEQDIAEIYYETTSKSEKLPLLKCLLLEHNPASCLIFCNTKEQTTELTKALTKEGFSAIALNGDMEQVDRDVALIRFENRSVLIMVATDVAARGLDIKELSAVINYDLAHDYDTHVHRIGRTGRAGSKGLAISLSTPEDGRRLAEHPKADSYHWGKSRELSMKNSEIQQAPMVTLFINAGKKDKIRPTDILGALTKDAGLPADAIGKINIAPSFSYVAIKRQELNKAFSYLQNAKLKGRKIIARKVV